MFKPTVLLFGTAGIPLSTAPRDTANGIKRVKELSLGAMELEFVRSINISKEKAPSIAAVQKETGILLTCHAPYFINLNTAEKPKLKASMDRILNSARITVLCNGWSVCFHPAFYQGQDPKKVYETVKSNIKEIMSTLKKEGIKIWIRPETTGKGSAFGDLQELLRISAELDMVMPCIDFAHLHARTGGKLNTLPEFKDMLEEVEKHLGKEGLNNMHIHLAGVAYTDKGEREHLNLKDSDMNYKDLLKALKQFKAKGVVISESPNIEQDAQLMQKTHAGS